MNRTEILVRNILQLLLLTWLWSLQLRAFNQIKICAQDRDHLDARRRALFRTWRNAEASSKNFIKKNVEEKWNG